MIVDKETLRQMRLESNRPSFRKNLVEKLGNKCANCGSEIDVEYHHIVPLAIGGTNRETNFAPLCYNCHRLLHGVKNIKSVNRTAKTGRKRKVPDGYEEILEKYLYGFIGKKECENLLGINGSAKLTDKAFFKEYLKEHGIVEYKNRVDMINCKTQRNKDHTGEILAQIKYSDGMIRTRYVK